MKVLRYVRNLFLAAGFAVLGAGCAGGETAPMTHKEKVEMFSGIMNENGWKYMTFNHGGEPYDDGKPVGIFLEDIDGDGTLDVNVLVGRGGSDHSWVKLMRRWNEIELEFHDLNSDGDLDAIRRLKDPHLEEYEMVQPTEREAELARRINEGLVDEGLDRLLFDQAAIQYSEKVQTELAVDDESVRSRGVDVETDVISGRPGALSCQGKGISDAEAHQSRLDKLVAEIEDRWFPELTFSQGGWPEDGGRRAGIYYTDVDEKGKPDFVVVVGEKGKDSYDPLSVAEILLYDYGENGTGQIDAMYVVQMMDGQKVGVKVVEPTDQQRIAANIAYEKIVHYAADALEHDARVDEYEESRKPAYGLDYDSLKARSVNDLVEEMMGRKKVE
jgi:hypothetical protein